VLHSDTLPELLDVGLAVGACVYPEAIRLGVPEEREDRAERRGAAVPDFVSVPVPLDK
jgi:hypothetical protein